MSFLKEVSDVFRALWLLMKQSVTRNKKNQESMRSIVIVLIVVGVGLSGFYGYRWYVAGREARAQKSFGEAMQLFEQALHHPKQWADVAGAMKIGYDQNSGSKLAPFFLFFRASAFVQQGKVAEAMSVMEEALKVTPSSSPLRSVYSVKLVLMKMDSDDQAVRSAGLQELTKLSTQEDLGADVAGYYLGLHYWNKGDIQKAREVWKRLAHMPEGEGRSPYALLVDEKLKQIS